MRFQGDPKLVWTEDGFDLPMLGGQPTCSAGLENIVLIRLFTRVDWPGTQLIGFEIGSNFLAACDYPLTVTTFNRIREAVKDALVDISSDIEVIVSNPTGAQLIVAIGIKLPTGDVKAFLLSRQGTHWYYQLREVT